MDLIRFQNAIALRDSGHADDALHELHVLETQASGADEKAALMGNEHRCYCDLGQLDEAERIMAEIRKLAPSDPDVLLNIDYGEACMHVQMGQPERGLLEFGEILRRHATLLRVPDSDFYAVIQKRRGIVLANLGRHAEAVIPLKESSAFGSLSDEDKQEVHFFLGLCYVEFRENALAKEEYLRAIDLGLHNDFEIHSRYRLAMVYFNTGAFAQAKHHLEAILQSYPGDVLNFSKKSVYEQLSHVCRRLGEEKQARQYAEMGQIL